jgi:hypothetical protein
LICYQFNDFEPNYSVLQKYQELFKKALMENIRKVWNTETMKVAMSVILDDFEYDLKAQKVSWQKGITAGLNVAQFMAVLVMVKTVWD